MVKLTLTSFLSKIADYQSCFLVNYFDTLVFGWKVSVRTVEAILLLHMLTDVTKFIFSPFISSSPSFADQSLITRTTVVYSVGYSSFQHCTELVFPQHWFAHKLTMTLCATQPFLAVFIFSAPRQVIAFFYDLSATAEDTFESFAANMIASTFRSDFLALVTGAIMTMTVVRGSAMPISCTGLKINV